MRDLEAALMLATLRVAARLGGVVSHSDLRQVVPAFVMSSDPDKWGSAPIPKSDFWEEAISKMWKNRMEPGNILYEGYGVRHPDFGFRISDNGLQFLEREGYKE